MEEDWWDATWCTGSQNISEVNENEWSSWENPRRGKCLNSTSRRILNFHEILSTFRSPTIFWEFYARENRVENWKTFDDSCLKWEFFSPNLKIIYAKIDLAPSRWESIKEEFAQWWFPFVEAIWIFPFIKALIVFFKLELCCRLPLEI